MNLSLHGKVALITGGSRGIGAATVRMFVAAGAKVAFNYQKAKAEAEKIISEGGNDSCAAFQAELDSPAAAANLVQATVKRFGRLDCLVANHGIWPPNDAPVDSMSDQQWRRTVAVNL